MNRLDAPPADPVFREPWQAQAFALVLELSRRGYFSWSEWSAALADEIRRASGGEDTLGGADYYSHWLAALERLVTDKGLCDPASLHARKLAWIHAYQHTPHGKPVELLQNH